jgi:hypothetical protein
MMTTEEMIEYDRVVDMGIATAEEINLVRNVLDGSWQHVLDSIVYARTGYRSIAQMIDTENEE